MPKRAITQLFVDRITPPRTGRVEYADKHLPGLRLRVSASGAMAWSVVYRVGGKLERGRIGTVAEIPRVDEARRRALASLAQARAGVSPVATRRAAAAVAAGNTVAAAVTRYLAQCDRNLAPKTAREWRRIFEHDVLPRWADRPLSEIDKGDVLALLDHKAASRERQRKGLVEGAGVQANRTLTRLRTFFGWAVAADLLAADPTAGIRKPARETARDRVLSDDEIVRYWTGCDTLGHPFGPLCRLLLLTAARKSEVAGAGWSEIDLAERTWTIPAARSKNGKPHIVALSDLAVEVLAAVPRVDGRDLLFSGTGRTPVSGFSKAKGRLDATIGATDWVFHDIRRSTTTGLARLGIPPHIADRVLNHQAGVIRGVMATYNRFEYIAERRSALDAWARYLETLIRPTPSNVVPIAAGRAEK